METFLHRKVVVERDGREAASRFRRARLERHPAPDHGAAARCRPHRRHVDGRARCDFDELLDARREVTVAEPTGDAVALAAARPRQAQDHRRRPDPVLRRLRRRARRGLLRAAQRRRGRADRGRRTRWRSSAAAGSAARSCRQRSTRRAATASSCSSRRSPTTGRRSSTRSSASTSSTSACSSCGRPSPLTQAARAHAAARAAARHGRRAARARTRRAGRHPRSRARCRSRSPGRTRPASRASTTSFVEHHVSNLRDWRPDDWVLTLVAFADGQPVGVQALRGAAFAERANGRHGLLARPRRGRAAASAPRCAQACCTSRSTASAPGAPPRARSRATPSRSASRASSATQRRRRAPGQPARRAGRAPRPRAAARRLLLTGAGRDHRARRPAAALRSGAVILRAFGETFVTLFVITDPIGNAPIFVAITRNLTPKQRQRAALRAVIAAGVFDPRLRRLRRDRAALPARLARLALDRGRAAADAGRARDAARLRLSRSAIRASAEDVALVPLATPLVAGPGAIATSIVLWRAHPGAGGHLAVIAAIIARGRVCRRGADRRRAGDTRRRARRSSAS